MSSLALVLYRAGFAGTLDCHSHCLFLAELPNVPVGKACLGHDTLDYLIPYSWFCLVPDPWYVNHFKVGYFSPTQGKHLSIFVHSLSDFTETSH